MHIFLTWSSVLNISSVCVRVTWIRWLRSMLCRLDFHQVLDLDHHITFYNIYDHLWMSLSYEPDDMQGKFFICMKKFEIGFLIGVVWSSGWIRTFFFNPIRFDEQDSKSSSRIRTLKLAQSSSSNKIDRSDSTQFDDHSRSGESRTWWK